MFPVPGLHGHRQGLPGMARPYELQKMTLVSHDLTRSAHGMVTIRLLWSICRRYTYLPHEERKCVHA
eukprot:9158108-Pyramimonas_sp.AAC.1